MLLQALNELAHAQGLLEDLAFREVAVRWLIVLDKNGNLRGPGPVDLADSDNRKGISRRLPATLRAKDSGGVAEFLADGLTAVFGLDADPDTLQAMPEKKRVARLANNAKKCRDFWEQVSRANLEIGSEITRALESFYAVHKSSDEPICAISVPFLRWGSSASPRTGEREKWWVRTSTGEEAPLAVSDTFAFEVDRKESLADPDLCSYWRRQWEEERAQISADYARGLCLVTGKANVPIARTHLPKIQCSGVLPGMGGSLISFNKEAFQSYGFSDSYNAPVSEDATVAYCHALNWLLGSESTCLRLGNTALAAWVKGSPDAGSSVLRLLERPDPRSVKEFCQSPWSGIAREIVRAERFHTLTISGNAGRAVIRDWVDVSLSEAARQIERWYADLEIVERPRRNAKSPGASREPLPYRALFKVAVSTVRDAKDLLPETPRQLFRAALTGEPLPLSMLSQALRRVRCELAKEGRDALYNASRLALVRLILNRNRRETDPIMEAELVHETADPAYNCGRLLAVFADLQSRAHEFKLDGPGVVEKYYGSASCAPVSAFPIMWRLHQHHLRKLEQTGKRGSKKAIQRKIAEICSQFSPCPPESMPDFPLHLSLREQGRFALGFYQQIAQDEMDRDAAKSQKTIVNDEDSQDIQEED